MVTIDTTQIHSTHLLLHFDRGFPLTRVKQTVNNNETLTIAAMYNMYQANCELMRSLGTLEQCRSTFHQYR